MAGEIKKLGALRDKSLITPEEFESLAQSFSEAKRKSETSSPTGHDRQPKSIADEIQKLAKLRAKGLITPEEFEGQKQRLIEKGYVYGSEFPSKSDSRDYR